LYSGPGASDAPAAPLLDQTPYFDGPAVAAGSSVPAEVRLDPSIPRGPRARLMNAIGAPTDDPSLQKFALARWDASTAYANVHYPFPLDQNPEHPQGSLLHFKFLSDFRAKVDEAIVSGEHWNNSLEYRRYDEWLSSPEWTPLYQPSLSRRYYGPESLVDARLLVPLDW
jgi:hypothetical protein